MKNQLLKTTMMVISLLFVNSVFGSNVTITKAPELSTNGDVKEITFSLSWENSWRDTENRWSLLYDKNWDAVWVFVKYRLSGSQWDHMYLDPDTEPSVGTDNGVEMAYQFGRSGEKIAGIFLYRAENGRGNVEWQDIKLGWKYNEEKAYLKRYTLNAADQIMVRVFAIEMVYIPEGAFYLGSGGDEDGAFRMAEEKRPFRVTSEDSIRLRAQNAADAVGALSCNAATTSQSVARNNIGVLGTLPEAFPKGFKGFYCMKYEISQGAYVGFLNVLNAWQQTYRTHRNNSTTYSYLPSDHTKKLRVFQIYNNSDRNGIELAKPYVYGVNLNSNDVCNEYDDGAALACALNPEAFLAYLDFCALRPMTELEFEKVCRGSGTPVPGEFAWNSTLFTSGSALDPGTINTPEEHPVVVGVNYLGTGQALLTRNGAFVEEGYGRVPAGSAKTGVMEMSNNLWEFCITVVSAEGRAYTGNHGDGRLTEQGFCNVEGWPEGSCPAGTYTHNHYYGLGTRGGSINEAITANGYQTISNRYYAYGSYGNTGIYNGWHVGGRGVRTVE